VLQKANDYGRAPDEREGVSVRNCRIITDPKQLPYYLTETEAAALCRRDARTVRAWVKDGKLRRGTHWVRPGNGGRLYLRDNLIAWLEERDRTHSTEDNHAAEGRHRTGFNLTRSPELAKMIGE
jgi:Helix-turn-helix domain